MANNIDPHPPDQYRGAMFKWMKKHMGKITINGVTIEGNNINISGHRVTVDGDVVGGLDFSSGTLDVRVEGNLASLKSDGSVKLIVGDVLGNVSAGGSVTCHDIGGNASAGGSIKAMSLAGNASAGGSVKINA
jgi:hypothetical protein